MNSVDGERWIDPAHGRPITAHGFRATFRTWAEESTAFPHAVIEQAMGHQVGTQAERAYRRTDVLEKRRALMEAWATYCEPQVGGNVSSDQNGEDDAGIMRRDPAGTHLISSIKDPAIMLPENDIDNVEEEDLDPPTFDELETLAGLLRAASPRKRLKGPMGETLRELSEIEALIAGRSASPFLLRMLRRWKMMASLFRRSLPSPAYAGCALQTWQSLFAVDISRCFGRYPFRGVAVRFGR